MRGRREWRQEYDDPLDRQLNVIPNDAILKINYWVNYVVIAKNKN